MVCLSQRMKKQYNLNGNLIFESSDGNGWVEWVEADDGTLHCLVGDIKIDKEIDVTILSTFKNRSDETRFKTVVEVKEYVKSLPHWNKTKYYSKITELGSSGLLDCKTGDVIDAGFEYDLHPHLVIKFNNINREEPCAMCGKRSQTKIPLGLFLFDYSSSAVFRPVCYGCGEKYAPILVRLLTDFFQNEDDSIRFAIQD